jgi:hypothetical protein
MTEEKDRSGRQENSPKGSPANSLKRSKVRGGIAGALQQVGPHHRDGRPARSEGQHRAGAAKRLLGGPRKG